MVVLDDSVHLGLERHEAVLAGRLGLVEGDVGIPKELGGRGPDSGGNSDAGGEGQRFAWETLELERGPEHLEQSLGHQFGPCVHGAPVDQDDELVATQAADAVALAHGHRKALGDRLEELVPNPVTEGVVHILESIEIDEQGRHLNIGSPGTGQHLIGAIEDEGPVGQSGQGVVDRLEADLVDQSGVGDGGGRLCGKPFESVGQPAG